MARTPKLPVSCASSWGSLINLALKSPCSSRSSLNSTIPGVPVSRKIRYGSRICKHFYEEKAVLVFLRLPKFCPQNSARVSCISRTRVWTLSQTTQRENPHRRRESPQRSRTCILCASLFWSKVRLSGGCGYFSDFANKRIISILRKIV